MSSGSFKLFFTVLGVATLLSVKKAMEKQAEKKDPFVETVKNYYSILGLDKNVDSQTIKSAYRELVKQYHPDCYNSANLPIDVIKILEEKFRLVREAYEILSDPAKRAEYDKII